MGFKSRKHRQLVASNSQGVAAAELWKWQLIDDIDSSSSAPPSSSETFLGRQPQRSALPLASLSGQQLQHAAGRLWELCQGVLQRGDSSPPDRLKEAHLTQGARLKAALQSFKLQHDWKASALELALEYGGVVAAGLAAGLAPQGPGRCDHNPLERCANCLTSVPFMLAGVHSCRHRKTLAGKAYGGAMVAVGAASTAFHACPPGNRWRNLARKLDFWTIAWCSNVMVRAVFPSLHPAVTVAGMLVTPFKPFAVSFINTTAMELLFLRRARRPDAQRLRRMQRVHAAACLAGLGAFTLEDLAPRLPLMHACWHVLSATAVFTVNSLLADMERERGLLVEAAPRRHQSALERGLEAVSSLGGLAGVLEGDAPARASSLSFGAAQPRHQQQEGPLRLRRHSTGASSRSQGAQQLLVDTAERLTA